MQRLKSSISFSKRGKDHGILTGSKLLFSEKDRSFEYISLKKYIDCKSIILFLFSKFENMIDLSLLLFTEPKDI